VNLLVRVYRAPPDGPRDKRHPLQDVPIVTEIEVTRPESILKHP